MQEENRRKGEEKLYNVNMGQKFEKHVKMKWNTKIKKRRGGRDKETEMEEEWLQRNRKLKRA
jgi:hypothetical protein